MKKTILIVTLMLLVLSMFSGCGFNIEDYLQETANIIISDETKAPSPTGTNNPIVTTVPTDTPAPTDTPVPTDTPTPTPEPTPAPKLEATLGATQIDIIVGSYSNNLRIAIPLTNTGNVNLYVYDTGIDIEDTSGNLIDTYSSFYVDFAPKVLAPGETGYYYFYNSYDGDVNANLVAKIKPEVGVAKMDHIRYDVSNVSLKESLITYQVIGKATNNTGAAQNDSLRVVFLAFDKNDNMIDFGDTLGEKMGVGESQSFKLNCYDCDMEDIARYEIYAYPNEYQYNW